MKQHITKEQLNELNDEQILELINFVYNQNHRTIEGRGSAGLEIEGRHYYTGDIAQFRCTIGKMIEFFQHKNIRCVGISFQTNPSNISVWEKTGPPKRFREQELCDALWKAVKHILRYEQVPIIFADTAESIEANLEKYAEMEEEDE